jgi:hypothetical protein
MRPRASRPAAWRCHANATNSWLRSIPPKRATFTLPSGRVYRFDAIGKRTDVGRLGEELEALVARLDRTPNVKYRRV